MYLVRNIAGKPVKPFVQTLSRSGTSTLDVPEKEQKQKPISLMCMIQNSNTKERRKRNSKGEHNQTMREWRLPVALTKRVQTKLICDLCSIHCIWQILLVGEHKKDSIPQLILHNKQN